MSISRGMSDLQNLAAAQDDMRVAYASGGAGVLASALAWTAAAIVALQVSSQQAVWTLFIGGMAIHPCGVLICKLMGRSGKHTAGNPLASLAAANTLWLIFSLPLAYVVSLQRIDWFFPAMLLIIGGRYLTFHPMFGLRLYWALGLSLALATYALVSMRASPTTAAFVGAAIEMVFAMILLARDRGPLPARHDLEQHDDRDALWSMTP